MGKKCVATFVLIILPSAASAAGWTKRERLYNAVLGRLPSTSTLRTTRQAELEVVSGANRTWSTSGTFHDPTFYTLRKCAETPVFTKAGF